MPLHLHRAHVHGEIVLSSHVHKVFLHAVVGKRLCVHCLAASV